MGFLTKDQIAAASDLPIEAVEVPEWGGSVGVRMMTAGEHARLGVDFQGVTAEERTLKAVFYVLAKTLVDEAGEPLFDGPAAVEVLGRKSREVIDRVYKEVERVNKLRPADVEDAAKN